MKKTIKIAKLELSNLFYSPIAWFLFLVFIFQASLNFTSMMESMVRAKDMSGGTANFGFLTSSIYCSFGSLFPDLLSKLYLYIPLLTMGLISREMSSGTISLLYSSPVKVREIILGKFLAMVMYCLCLMAILVIFIIAGALTIPSMDYGLALSAFLGVFLLLCTYSAIGLFMSCLTTYQVVAAISTFVIFALLAYVGQIWQDIDFIRDLTYFLSISGRTEKMVSGLITTKDVFYFIIIIALFLSFSILKLQSGRETKPWYLRLGKYVALVLLALFFGYFSSRPGYIGYFDATNTKTNTLTENAQKIIAGLDGPLKITSYDNLLTRYYTLGAPSRRNDDVARWEPYVRFKKDISLHYVYYYDSIADKYMYLYGNKGLSLKQIAQRRAKGFKVDLSKFKTPAEIHQEIDLRPEGNSYVMQLEYKGKKTFLRLFDDPMVFPGETEVSAAIKRLTSKLPRIGFLEGDFERSPDNIGDRDYLNLTSQKTFRYALINQGFDIQTLTLDSASSIPADITALVIADPRRSLSAGAMATIQSYVDKGGNLLVLGEPGKQSILNPLLQPLGVRLMDGQLVQQSNHFAPNLILSYLTQAASKFSKTLHQAFADSVQVSMPGAVALQYRNDAGFKVSPLLMADSLHTWITKSHLVVDSAQVHFSAGNGDMAGAFTTALALTRQRNGHEQRIIITGDADIMSNAELGRRNLYTGNFQFNTAVFGWFTYGAFPIDSFRPKAKDNHLNLGDSGVTVMKLFFLGILPGLLLLFATVLLIRRKRK